uniref:Uncharacterized protein n=1 Tax=Anguilla anguilla TaxID=7936 RepID=A0A0E9UZ50_ANGAN
MFLQCLMQRHNISEQVASNYPGLLKLVLAVLFIWKRISACARECMKICI